MHNQRTIFVCQGTGCFSSGADTVYEALKTEVARLGLKDVEVDFTGCHGFCEQGPNVVIEPEGIFYTHVQDEDAPEIVSSHLRDGKPVVVVGEVKSRIHCREVEQFSDRLRAVSGAVPGKIFPLMFGYYIGLSAQEPAGEDIHLIASYQPSVETQAEFIKSREHKVRRKPSRR